MARFVGLERPVLVMHDGFLAARQDDAALVSAMPAAYRGQFGSEAVLE